MSEPATPFVLAPSRTCPRSSCRFQPPSSLRKTHNIVSASSPDSRTPWSTPFLQKTQQQRKPHLDLRRWNNTRTTSTNHGSTAAGVCSPPSRVCTVSHFRHHCSTAATSLREMLAQPKEEETLIWEREGAVTCHPVIAQSTGQLVKAAVNSGQILVNIVKMVKQEGQNWKLDRN